MKKNILKVIIVLLLLVLYIYVVNITLLPDKLVMIQGENLKFRMAWGVEIEVKETSNPNIASKTSQELVQASGTEESILQEIGTVNYQIKLGSINLKEVTATVIPKTKVVPLGNAIGLKLYTSGVLVVGMSEIEGKKPYENSGIEEGDRIVEVNNKAITCTDDLVKNVNQSKGKEVKVKYVKDEQEKETIMIPAKTNENEYKLGLWVRDAAAGVGTATFYIPETGEVAALRSSEFQISIQKN